MDIGLSTNDPLMFSSIKALYDTGSTITVLREEILAEPPLKMLGYRDVLGVNGFGRYKTCLGALSLPTETGPYIIEDHPIAIRPRDSDPNFHASFDMILGMDVIEKGVLTVDGPGAAFVFDINP
ncbi:MAG: hypothetical protein AAF788_05620 [Pseudomonadota bacterium]